MTLVALPYQLEVVTTPPGATVRVEGMHVAGALRALGCATRAEAVHAAGQGGLLDD